MTRIFTEDGVSVPVTVVEVQPNRVTQVKDEERDGYRAIQITTGTVKTNKVNKAAAGHFRNAGVEAGKGLWEFRVNPDEAQDIQVGHEITVTIFEEGQKVDAVGTTIGKGYAGVIKRHNFQMQDATHGNSLSHRAPARSGRTRPPAEYSRVRRWRVTWVMCNVPRKISRWPA